MFSKFSKFRSKGGSQTISPRRELQQHDDDDDDHQDVFYFRSIGKPSHSSSPQAPRTPPVAPPQHLNHRRATSPLPSPVKQDDLKPSLSAAVPLEPNYDTDDTDENVSFAESLFPVTPSGGAVQRRSSESSWSSSDGKVESVHEMSRRGSWEQKRDAVESKHTTWDANPKRIDRTGTAMSDWTSSSVPEEEEMDSGPPVVPPYDDAEEEFLEEFEDYFNYLQVDRVRREQYPKLELQKLVYLDYASFALFSNFQVERHLEILLAEGPCLGSAAVVSQSDNPLFVHVTDTQQRLLRLLNTTSSQYSVIFTAGFQESFRLVAESFPFQRGSPLLVCQDNHAAVRPVIQSALRAGGRAILAPVTERELCFHSHELHKLLRRQSGRYNTSNGGLFVYPAQSNLSGVKHSLSWVVEAQQSGWHVCVDATTILPTNPLDLDIHQPDIVVGSFHHMVGYPSGLGFLLIRRDSFCVQPSPSGTFQLLRNQPPEDGADCHIICPADNTMNLLQFAALNLGLLHLERIGFVAIQKRTRALVQWLLKQLRNLRHNDDESRHLVRVYGSHAVKDRGSIVSFNVIDFSGTVLPPEIVRKMAARSNIKVSVGNFNNPGLSNLLGGAVHERSNVDVGILEKNWGFMAVRASFGAVSNFSDVYRLVQFLSKFRDEEFLASEAMGFVEERNQMER